MALKILQTWSEVSPLLLHILTLVKLNIFVMEIYLDMISLVYILTILKIIGKFSRR